MTSRAFKIHGASGASGASGPGRGKPVLISILAGFHAITLERKKRVSLFGRFVARGGRNVRQTHTDQVPSLRMRAEGSLSTHFVCCKSETIIIEAL